MEQNGDTRNSPDVMQRISMHMDKLTRSQQKVADYIQNHTMEAAFSTVDRTAHTVDVSTTTVVRLAISLGYAGYAEMQNALKEYMTVMSSPIHMFSAVTRSEKDASRSTDYMSLMELEIQNIQETYAAIVTETVEKAAKALSNAHNIYVIGGRTSEAPARYFAYNLDRMFLNAQFAFADTNHVPELVNRMGKEDVLIYIINRRYLRSVYEATRYAKMTGATVIGLIDAVSNTWIPFTDYTFYCANQSANFFHSPVSAMFIANVLMKQCVNTNRGRVEANLKKLEDSVQNLKLFLKN